MLRLLTKRVSDLISTLASLLPARLPTLLVLAIGALQASEAPLRFCGDASLIPLEYYDDAGRPQGFNVEVVREVARRAKIPIEIRLGLMNDMLAKLERGECHLIAVAYNEERAAKYHFLGQIRLANQVVSFPASRLNPPRRLDQMTGEVIAVWDQSNHRGTFGQMPAAVQPRMLPVPTHEEIIRAVMSGAATAAVGNEVVLRRMAQRFGLPGGMQSIPVKAFSIHLVSSGLNLATEARLQKALEEMRRAGAFERIEDEAVNGRTSWRTLKDYAWVVGGIAVVVLLVVFWNAALRREVRRRTVELSLAKAAAEQSTEEMRLAKIAAEHATNAKSAFLAAMSHEIRTPMNGILGMASLLNESALSVEQRECASTIQAAGESLLVIINDILDISKIEAGRIELESIPFRFAEIVRQVVDLEAPQAAVKGIRLGVADIEAGSDTVYPGPGPVIGDPVRIRQVLLNLVSNAVKFTDRGTVLIEYSSTVVDEVQTRIRVTVTDTGIGIAAESIGRLFTPFTQADASTTRRYGGTGLGLSISKRLVDCMGGEMGVSSIPGVGSCFWMELVLPLSTGAADLDERPFPEDLIRLAGCAGRVLVAEDNPVNQLVARRMLERLGYRCTVSKNGREAVEEFGRDQYDMVLMDCQMPEMDGFAATVAIRALERGTHIPIIAMTANVMQEDRERCWRAGMDGFLAKPVQIEDLRALLATGFAMPFAGKA